MKSFLTSGWVWNGTSRFTSEKKMKVHFISRSLEYYHVKNDGACPVVGRSRHASTILYNSRQDLQRPKPLYPERENDVSFSCRRSRASCRSQTSRCGAAVVSRDVVQRVPLRPSRSNSLGSVLIVFHDRQSIREDGCI